MLNVEKYGISGWIDNDEELGRVHSLMEGSEAFWNVGDITAATLGDGRPFKYFVVITIIRSDYLAITVRTGSYVNIMLGTDDAAPEAHEGVVEAPSDT
jgi:hypothetical protein